MLAAVGAALDASGSLFHSWQKLQLVVSVDIWMRCSLRPLCFSKVVRPFVCCQERLSGTKLLP